MEEHQQNATAHICTKVKSAPATETGESGGCPIVIHLGGKLGEESSLVRSLLSFAEFFLLLGCAPSFFLLAFFLHVSATRKTKTRRGRSVRLADHVM